MYSFLGCSLVLTGSTDTYGHTDISAQTEAGIFVWAHRCARVLDRLFVFVFGSHSSQITTTVIQRTCSTAVFAKRSGTTDVVNVRKDVYTDAVELDPIRSADDRKISGYDNDRETHSSMWAK